MQGVLEVFLSWPNFWKWIAVVALGVALAALVDLGRRYLGRLRRSDMADRREEFLWAVVAFAFLLLFLMAIAWALGGGGGG